MKKPIKKVDCGDWHLGWGFGYTLVGKLSIEIVDDCPVNFIWKGKSCGRHGQNYGKRSARFMLTGDTIRVTEKEGSYPVKGELIKSMNILLREHGMKELDENIIIEDKS